MERKRNNGKSGLSGTGIDRSGRSGGPDTSGIRKSGKSGGSDTSGIRKSGRSGGPGVDSSGIKRPGRSGIDSSGIKRPGRSGIDSSGIKRPGTPGRSGKRQNEVTIRSFAKINLSIDVGPPRPDGYHPVDMVMQQLYFHDDVKVVFRETPGGGSGNHQIRLTSNRRYLPTDERNLAYRAAMLMIREYGQTIPSGLAEIRLFKRIPIAAGLAGGSGNGAAVIHGLNAVWDLDLSLDEIFRLCEEVGSDVPFCAMGQANANPALPEKIRRDRRAASCARATGRGTILEPVTGIEKPIVIAKPGLSVSTAEVYRGIDHCGIPERPDNERLIRDMQAGNDRMYENFINVLENYTLLKYKEVAGLKDFLSGTDAEKVLMSGSGPTVFAVYRDVNRAEDACARAREAGYEAYRTRTLT